MVGTARCAVRAAYQRRNVDVLNALGLSDCSARCYAGGDIAARCPYRPRGKWGTVVSLQFCLGLDTFVYE